MKTAREKREAGVYVCDVYLFYLSRFAFQPAVHKYYYSFPTLSEKIRAALKKTCLNNYLCNSCDVIQPLLVFTFVFFY